MNNVNFCNFCLKICTEKKKPVGPRFYWKVFTVGQMLSRTLDRLYFCATWVKINPLNQFYKILEMVKFFVGKNASSALFVGKYFRQLMKNSSPDK